MDELIINGVSVQLPEKTSIKYTRQISDIFDISQVACSFTSSFSFDKTPNNTEAMQSLGIVGDSSLVPYIKNTASLKSSGFNLIPKGWFTPTETNEKYQGNIIDGMIDFFKAIENKTLGTDLDLSNFEHEKTLSTVVNSYSNQYYKYLIADYGGKIFFDAGINIDYLTPSFSVRKLWELIFSTFKFECDYTYLSSYIDSLFITYPKDVTGTVTEVLIADLSKGFFETILLEIRYLGTYSPTIASGFFNWDSSTVTEGSLLDNRRYVIPENGTYTFEMSIEAYVTYKAPNTHDLYSDPAISIFKNGTSFLNDFGVDYPSDEVGNIRNSSIKVICNKGDIIEVLVWTGRQIIKEGNNFFHNAYSITSNAYSVKIYQTDLGTTTLQNELKDFQIKDFIKEILWRTGLTPVYSSFTNIVSFVPLSKRIDFTQAQDMSNFYKERTREIYQNDYAQKNIFKLKTDLPEDNTGDGYLYVNNSNLSDSKVIVQSRIYPPNKNIVTQFDGFKTDQYKIWDTETKLNEDDSISVTYKGLNGKFYFVRWAGLVGSYKFTSEKLTGSLTISLVNYALSSNTLFDEAVYNNYQEYQKIFNNFRVHTISLTLTLSDFMGVDLLRPVFFRQEAAYYICNSLNYEDGKLSSGDFIKINNI